MRPLARRSRRPRGVMLAEFAMTCAIGGLILSVLPAFYMASAKLWQRETGEIGAREQADMAIQRMKKELRNSRSTAISSDGGTLTLVLPAVSGASTSQQSATVFNSEGRLVDGDRVEYYFQADSGSAGGSIYRRVTHPDGTGESPKPVANHLYPRLNPLRTAATAALPVFSYDTAKRTVTVTVTAAQARPTTGTFAPERGDPVCAKHGVSLVRVATSTHPEGLLSCYLCNGPAMATSEVVTYQATLLLRNR